MEISKKEKLALIALYPVLALETVFLFIALTSFFIKKDVLTKYLLWKGSWIWILLGLLFIGLNCILAVQGLFILRGKYPPLYPNKSAWSLSSDRARKHWIVYTWSSVIGTGAMIILSFAVNSGAWGIIPIVIALVLIVCSKVLLKTSSKRLKDSPKSDLS